MRLNPVGSVGHLLHRPFHGRHGRTVAIGPVGQGGQDLPAAGDGAKNSLHNHCNSSRWGGKLPLLSSAGVSAAGEISFLKMGRQGSS